MSENAQSRAESRAQEIVLRNLDRIPGRRKAVNGGVVMIVCPFHPDRNPSCMLNIAKTERFELGFFSCRGCGANGGWNKLAEKCGLETISESDLKLDRVRDHDLHLTRQALLSTKDEEEEEDDDVSSSQTMADLFDAFKVDMPTSFPVNMKWRGVRGKLLRRIGAYLAYDGRSEEQVVILPVRIDNITVGGIKAKWKKDKSDAGTSYLTSKGDGWAKREALFPYDYALKLAERKGIRVIVVVEGPRDALRLLRYGIPAVAICGSQNWSKDKASLLIDSGLHVIIAMDGDNAGEAARKMIRKSLKPHGDYSVFNLLKIGEELGIEKMDPGNAPMEVIEELKEICQRFTFRKPKLKPKRVRTGT